MEFLTFAPGIYYIHILYSVNQDVYSSNRCLVGMPNIDISTGRVYAYVKYSPEIVHHLSEIFVTVKKNKSCSV